MGYGAILGQTPRIDEALAAYDKTIKDTYPIATGNSVTAGDVVDVVDGEVTRSVVAEANVENAYYTGNPVTANVVCCLNDGVSVVFASSSTSSTLALFLIDNQGGKVINVHGLNVSGTKLSITRLNDTKFIVTWYDGNNIQSACGTVNDTTISLGSSQYLVAVSDVNSQSLVPLSETSCAVIYGTPTRLGVHVCTISGTTITQGTNKIVTTHSTYSVSATLLPDDSSSNKRVCVCFVDAYESGIGKAVIITIDSSNAVTWGSVVTFNSVETNYISCTAKGNVVFVSYESPHGPVRYANAKRLTVNGTSITNGTAVRMLPLDTTSDGAQYTNILTVGDKVVVLWTQGKGYAQLLSVSGETITYGATYKFNTSSANYISSATIDSRRFIVAYNDSGNANYGTSTILEVNGNQIAGSFTVNSTQAIALQSGEAGQNIEVIFAGTTAADFVTEGRKIPSDGVYGYGPMAGWLNVIPYWAKEAGAKIVTGSYVGTGSYGASNPNSLAIGFNAAYMAIYPNIAFSNSRNQHYGVFLPGLKKFGTTDGNSVPAFQYSTISTSNGTITWYTTVNETYQLNTSGVVYYYIAIG